MNETQVFHLFAKLSKELRLKIWEESLPGPRTICITLQATDRIPQSKPVVADRKLATALLHVNQESREVAKKEYPICFTFLLPHEHVRFNSRLDTLLLTNPSIFETDTGELDEAMEISERTVKDLSPVRNLVLTYNPTEGKQVDAINCQSRHMHDLENLIIMVESSFEPNSVIGGIQSIFAILKMEERVQKDAKKISCKVPTVEGLTRSQLETRYPEAISGKGIYTKAIQ
jgi:hypothetical protein